MLSGVWDGGLASVLDVQSLFFLIKENWIWTKMTHANNILTRNLPFDPDVRQSSHPLMIPLHCLWASWNYRMRGQFECDVLCFCFVCFDFVYSHGRCSCCSIDCLRFQDMQIKQVDCKMSTKNVNKYKNKKHFVIFLYNCTNKNIKSRKST